MSAPPLIDSHGRTLRDLRISVTDRCNFRCLYCLPETEAAQNFYRDRWAQMPASKPIVHAWQPKNELLTFEEIERFARIAVDAGIETIRLTGGEPLLRNNLEGLVARLAAIPGLKDLAMTSNGFLFLEKGRALKAAGLKRVTFSLDSLERENFKKITGRDGLAEVLASIELATELELQPVKVNAVIIRGINDGEIEALAALARDRNLAMRFIEFMPLDSARAWQKELVMPSREILGRLQSAFELKSAPLSHAGATSRRWTFSEGAGEVGLISPISEPFCGHCNRLRLTADGKIRTCLFSTHEHDLKAHLRGGESEEEIGEFLRGVVWQKEDRHHIGELEFVAPERSMSCIGG